MKGEDIVRKITEVGLKDGMEISRAFTEMLDAFISFLSIERLKENKCDVVEVMRSIKDEKWFETFTMWLEWVNERQKGGVVIDAFDFYEDAVKSKGKAQVFGQFYTPITICDMMAELTYTGDKEVSVVNDSAVGSGRTLLGYANILSRKKSPEVAYYIANDIDEQSVKMCTINFAINGMIGRVLCADGLMLHYNYGYEINEIKYPMWSNATSIRRLPDSQHSDDDNERKRECVAMMSLEADRKEKLQALYELRTGNIEPCVKMIPSDNLLQKEVIIAQLQPLAKAMAEYYGIKPEDEQKQPIEQTKTENRIIIPKQKETTNKAPQKWVQRSLFD